MYGTLLGWIKNWCEFLARQRTAVGESELNTTLVDLCVPTELPIAILNLEWLGVKQLHSACSFSKDILLTAESGGLQGL